MATILRVSLRLAAFLGGAIILGGLIHVLPEFHGLGRNRLCGNRPFIFEISEHAILHLGMVVPPLLWYYGATGDSGIKALRRLDADPDSSQITIRGLTKASVAVCGCLLFLAAGFYLWGGLS